MNNKVLISIEIPEISNSFDLFIPVNEQVWKISKLVSKAVSDMTGTILNTKDNYIFINKDNGKIYSQNEVIINTDIRNGSELILLKI